MLKRINPTSLLYFGVHVIVFLIGSLFLAIDWGESKTLKDAVGTSLIAASIAGLFLFLYIRHAEDIRVRVQMMLALGLQQAFDVRGVNKQNEYKKRLNIAKSNIDVMGYGLNTFLEEHREDFEVWKARCNVRILLIDPDYPDGSPYSVQRDLEESKDIGTIKREVERFIQVAEGLNKRTSFEGRGRFDVKLYRALPNITICRIDDEILWGPYFVGTLSRNTPMFVVKKGGVMYDQILSQFNKIWESKDLSCIPENLRD